MGSLFDDEEQELRGPLFGIALCVGIEIGVTMHAQKCNQVMWLNTLSLAELRSVTARVMSADNGSIISSTADAGIFFSIVQQFP